MGLIVNGGGLLHDTSSRPVLTIPAETGGGVVVCVSVVPQIIPLCLSVPAALV